MPPVVRFGSFGGVASLIEVSVPDLLMRLPGADIAVIPFGSQ